MRIPKVSITVLKVGTVTCPSHKSRLLALVYLLTSNATSKGSDYSFRPRANSSKSVDPHPTRGVHRGSAPAAQYGNAFGGMQPQYLSSPGPTRTRPPGQKRTNPPGGPQKPGVAKSLPPTGARARLELEYQDWARLQGRGPHTGGPKDRLEGWRMW